MAELVRERETNGRFKDLFDLARRLDAKIFNRGHSESLVKAGAFEYEPEPGADFASAELLLREGQLQRNRTARMVRGASSASASAIGRHCCW